VATQDVIQAYQRAKSEVDSRPSDATAVFNLAWWGAKAGHFTDAIAAYEQSIALGLMGAEEAMSNIASIYSERLGDVAAARQWLAQALQRNDRYFPAVFNTAHIAEQCGDRAIALEFFERALALQPADDYVLARLCEALLEAGDDHPRIIALRRAATRGDPDVLFALARVEERLGNIDAAWKAMAAANDRDAQRLGTWPTAKVRELNLRALADGSGWDAHDGLSTSAVLTDNGPEAPSQGVPLFIVGMFRTGSTLLEQILSAHSAFMPLGESEFWPRTVAKLGGSMLAPGQLPDAALAMTIKSQFWRHVADRGIDVQRWVTDKRPDNLFHLPLILRTLPQARVVITQRDWRDTLVSVYGTRLHGQHAYATDISKIAEQIALCNEIAAICAEKWPNRIYIQSYENLIGNPEDQLKRLFKWLGLSWEPSCLDFHLQRNSVRTASVWQVREPLNNRRLARWRQYEPQLRAALGDKVDSPEP